MNSRLQVNQFFGAGGGWKHSYQWSCTAPSGTTNPPASVTVNYPDGRDVIFTHSSGTTYTSPLGVADRFQGFVGFGNCYLLRSDGSKVVFYQSAYSDGRGGYNVYYDPPTQIIDPQSLVTTLTYDVSGYYLTKVKEPAGRSLKIYYNSTGPYTNFISEVDACAADDHVSQWVKYTYASQSFGGTSYKVLTKADYIYAVGLEPQPVATYTYQQSNVAANGVPLIKTCKDVRYPGPMKNIGYDFTSSTYGRLWHEKNFNSDGSFTIAVTLAVPNSTTRTETRGDGPSRTFTYGASPGGTYTPYLLKTYTDFIAKTPKNTTTLGYDANGYVNLITDPNTHNTSFTRLAATGAITKVTHPNDANGVSSNIQYEYEDPTTGYYLSKITDERGKITTYKHGNTTTMTTSEIDYPDGGIETFIYNSFNQVTSHTKVSDGTGTTGGTDTYSYDTHGLLKTHTPSLTGSDPNPSLHPTQYVYNSNDHLSTITDPRGNVTTLYHNEVGQLTIIEHDDTDKTQISYAYNADGTLDFMSVEYSSTATATTDYSYDDYKRLKSIVRPLRFTGDTSGRTTYFWYDATGASNDYTHTDPNPTFVTTPAGVDIANVYDNNFRKTSVTVGDTSRGAESLPATTSYTYDNVGNLKTRKDPNGQTSGATWTYFYDPRDRLTGVNDPIATDRNADGYTTSYTYDLASNKKSEKRANNQVLTYDTYDNMNRLTQMTVGQGATTPAAVSHYTWTRAGKLETMTDPGTGGAGNLYSYDYDTLNRLITTTYPTPGGTETRTYDFAGNLATFKNRAGNKQTFTYDSRNRELSYSWDDGVTPPRTLTYDDASRILTCLQNTLLTRTYYADGLLQSEHMHNYNYLDYDGTISYTYDADGRKATVEYPSGRKFSLGYTPRGELRTLYDITNGSTSTYQAWYIYDPSGNLTTRNINLAQTHSTFSSYDTLNRLGQAQHFLVGGSPKFNYGYDEVSRRQYEQRDGALADGFGYTTNDQLTSFQRDGTLSGSTVSNSLTSSALAYDASGNRISLAVTAGGTTDTTSYVANNLNQYSTVDSLGATYAGGNLKTYNGWTYTYDAMNRLTSAVKGAASADFWYDGFNRVCTWQENGDANHRFNVWDGWDLVAEYPNNTDPPDREYLHGAGSDELVSMTKGGQTYYFYQDGRGNASQVTDSSGALVETYKYDVFGAPTITVAPGKTATGNRFMFSGREYFASVGLYNYRNRFYSPGWGRLLQPDPIGFAGDPANLYRYCGNNPVNWSDPSGLGNKLDGGGSDGTPEVSPIVVTAPAVSYRGSGPGPLDGFMPNISGSGEPGEFGLLGDRPYPKDPSKVNTYDIPGTDAVTTLPVTIGFGTPPVLRTTVAVFNPLSFSGGNPYLDSAPFIAELGRGSDPSNMNRLANAFDYGVGYPAAAAVALAAAPAIPSLLSQLGGAAMAAPQAVQAGIVAARVNAARVTTSIYLGVVAPTVSLNVNNPHVREILEEAYEEWKLYGPR